MSARDYCKNRSLPEAVKVALLELVDRLDYYYYDSESRTYVGLEKVVADQLRFIHRELPTA